MTDFSGTQIGPDGRRYALSDLSGVGKSIPGGGGSWSGELLSSASRSTSGHSPALAVGDRDEARLDLNVDALGGTNEVQTVTLANATGGTFTLTFSGQTTAAIAYNATAAAVQTALEALSNVAPGDVTVTGSAGGPYTVTFGGALGGQNVAQLTSSATSLTSGTTATITHATTTAGVAPTLDVTVETSSTSNGSFTALGTFTQMTTATTQHKVFEGMDEYLRISYVIAGGSVTFDVSGELV